jgi:hypothetical protein
MAPAYVKPYVKRQKNDARDAEAICEAVTRPRTSKPCLIAYELSSGREPFIRRRVSTFKMDLFRRSSPSQRWSPQTLTRAPRAGAFVLSTPAMLSAELLCRRVMAEATMSSAGTRFAVATTAAKKSLIFSMRVPQGPVGRCRE